MNSRKPVCSSKRGSRKLAAATIAADTLLYLLTALAVFRRIVGLDDHQVIRALGADEPAGSFVLDAFACHAPCWAALGIARGRGG